MDTEETCAKVTETNGQDEEMHEISLHDQSDESGKHVKFICIILLQLIFAVNRVRHDIQVLIVAQLMGILLQLNC